MTDILTEARERFKLAQDAESENRELAEEDIRFANGDQWPEEAKRIRGNSRPCLVINRIPTFVRQVVNDIRQVRPAIKVRGIDSGSDPETAKILNGLIRAIEQDSNAEAAYDWAAEHAIIGGWGYWRVDTKYADDDSFQQVIEINRIRNQFSVYLDPSAEQADGSDAKWGFITELRDKKSLEAEYGKDLGEWPSEDASSYHEYWYTKDKARVAEYFCIKEDPITLTLLSDGSTYEGDITDEEAEAMFASGFPHPVDTRKSVKRTVNHYLLTGHKELEHTELPGKYIPIVRVLGDEAVIDGKVVYKGMVRDMQDPMRQYNYMRSASAERIALTPKAPYVGPRGAFKDPKWRRANTENYAYLEYDPVGNAPPPTRERPPEVSPGLIAEIQHSADELKAVTGIYDSALGAQANEIAGVAINARKLESDISNFHYVDNLARAIRYTGKILVDLIPKIYNDQRWVTILGADGSEDKVQLNNQYMEQSGERQGMKRNTMLSVGKYDVAVDVGPSFTTQRQEAVTSMLEIAKAFPQSVSVMGDLIAKNMDWPEADEISKRLKMLLPPEILKGESPQIAAMLQQFQQKEQAGIALIGQMQEQIKMLSTELQKQEQTYQIKLAELNEKRRATDLKHTEGMTKLELEAARDISREGLAY